MNDNGNDRLFDMMRDRFAQGEQSDAAILLQLEKIEASIIQVCTRLAATESELAIIKTRAKKLSMYIALIVSALISGVIGWFSQLVGKQ